MYPAEIRRKKLIKTDQYPNKTLSGAVYDAGDYPKAFEKLLEMGGYEALLKEREKARKEGRLFGIGVALGVDPSGSNMGYMQMALPAAARKRPMSGSAQATTIQMDHGGAVTVELSTVCHGQGHETVVAQVVADEL